MRLHPLSSFFRNTFLVAALLGLFQSANAQVPSPSPAPASGSAPARPHRDRGLSGGLPVQIGAPAADDMIPELIMRDMELSQALELLERLTGRSVLRPGALPANTYTLTIKKPISKAEAVVALETLFGMNQIAIVPLGDKFLKVVPSAMARNEAPEFIEGSTLGMSPSSRIAAKLFHLDFLRVSEIAQQLPLLINQTLANQPMAFEKSNSILITDTITILQRIEAVLKEVDRPVASHFTTKTYTLEFAKASDVVTKIKSFITAELQKDFSANTTYTADDRTNQIILISHPAEQNFFDNIITKLDIRADPNTRSEVIFLKHAKAPDVNTILTQLISGQNNATRTTTGGQQGAAATTNRAATTTANRTATANQQQRTAQNTQASRNTAVASALSNQGAASEQFSTLLTVVADERSNSIIISGTADDIRLTRELIDKIDVLLAQVRIEVVIAEVSLSDEATSGIDTLGLRIENGVLTGFAASGAGGKIAGIDNGTFFQTAKENALAGVISLSTTPRKNNTNILSVPTIVTSHNQEAEVFIGEKRPIITGTTTTSDSLSTSSQITQQQIGITLTVTPLIGPNGSVQMQLEQKVEDISGFVTIDGNEQPITTDRNAKSFLSARSGDIVVLGGMQRTKKGNTTSRLGPIPWIGDLFGKRSKTDQRTEILFFIRPTVLTNTQLDNVEAYQQVDRAPHAAEIRKVLDTRPLAAPTDYGPTTITRTNHAAGTLPTASVPSITPNRTIPSSATRSVPQPLPQPASPPPPPPPVQPIQPAQPVAPPAPPADSTYTPAYTVPTYTPVITPVDDSTASAQP